MITKQQQTTQQAYSNFNKQHLLLLKDELLIGFENGFKSMQKKKETNKR